MVMCLEKNFKYYICKYKYIYYLQELSPSPVRDNLEETILNSIRFDCYIPKISYNRNITGEGDPIIGYKILRNYYTDILVQNKYRMWCISYKKHSDKPTYMYPLLQ